jgi:hypothetical protein
MPNEDDTVPTTTLHQGDESWHDGPGWYYVIDDYPDEGSCGAFGTREHAFERAQGDGYDASERTAAEVIAALRGAAGAQS